MARTVSSTTCARTLAGWPWSSNSSRCQPKPTPSTNRPSLSTSSVAIDLASAMASCSPTSEMQVPMSRSVWAATNDRAMNGHQNREYRPGIGPPAGNSLREWSTGICGCSLRNSPVKPRSVSACARSRIGIDSSVQSANSPIFGPDRPSKAVTRSPLHSVKPK
jgi:hypothetical protein